MSASLRIVVRADAAPGMGGGHVLRCLALADALHRRGAEVTFACASLPASLAQRIESAGHGLVRLPTALPPTRAPGWEGSRLDEDLQRADATATEAAGEGAAWTIVDHYLLDRCWGRETGSASKLLVIDDLANRPHDCDLLLDQNLGRSGRDYADLLPNCAKCLIGPAFALLREEFALRRAASLRRRREMRPVERIVIATGMADIDAASGMAARAALRSHPDCRVDIVVGSIASTIGQLEALAIAEPRISLHVDSERVADLLSAADVAVGAAGTSAWERCCLGVPSLVIALAANQRAGARALAAEGAALVAEDEGSLSDQLRRLIDDPALRSSLTAACAAITDGLGADRVADIIIGGPDRRGRSDLAIRPAAPQDAEILWVWRNDPVTRAFSQTSDPVPWPDHAGWLDRTLASSTSRIFIVEVAGRPAGMVRMDRTGDAPATFRVSINVAPAARGGGLGRPMLAAGCRKILEEEGPAQFEAVIRADNVASRRTFQALGFAPARQGVGEGGFERYLRPEELLLNGL